jgi:hypothetical protein
MYTMSSLNTLLWSSQHDIEFPLTLLHDPKYGKVSRPLTDSNPEIMTRLSMLFRLCVNRGVDDLINAAIAMSQLVVALNAERYNGQ